VRLLIAVVVVGFAISALAADSGLRASETEHVSRTLKLDPGGTLRLQTFSGSVTVEGEDRADVVIDADRRASRDLLDEVPLEIRSTGSSVVVNENSRSRRWSRPWVRSRHVVETDFNIRVPRRANLDISVFSALVNVRSVDGTHRVHSFSGPVTLDEIVGRVDAHSFSGAIQVRERAWDAEVIDVNTFSGNIWLRLPESARGQVRFDSFSGRLTAEMPLTLDRGSRKSIRGRLGESGSGGDVRLKTFSGNVRISR